MNILMICPEYPPKNIGGGGIVYKNLANELSKKEIYVEVIAGDFTNQKIMGEIKQKTDKKIPLSFIPLIPLPKNNLLNLRTYTPPTLKGLNFIIKRIIKSRNEIIHFQGLFHPMIDITAMLCLIFQKKYIYTSHGIPKSPENSNFFMELLFKSYQLSVVKFLLKKAEIVTAVSDNLQKELESTLEKKKIIVIPNGISDNLINAKNMPINQLEKKYNLKDRSIIFSIGRLSKNKGFQYLINAIPAVLSKNPQIMVLIAGIGPFERNLRKQILEKNLSKQVKLLGWISEQEKIGLYKRSTVVVFPSTDEPFGLVILEGMAMHKPVIAFNTESAKFLIDNEIDGILVPLGDYDKLSKAIDKILNNGILRQKIIANSSEKIKFFKWKNIVQKYIDLYQKINISPK